MKESRDPDSKNAQGNMACIFDDKKVLYGEATMNAKGRKLFSHV